jgi:tRNA pseudouridine synthase 8/2,5-diamino-6-(5-phospho-D-ribitylamino)-pyrimidin-4(3H)-one deaminase
MDRPRKKVKPTPASNYLSPIVRTVKDGLRYIEPYQYEYRAHVKGRWVGKSIIQVCSREFVAQTRQYYEDAIKDGRVTINHKRTQCDYVLDHNDLLCHRATCQENPVSADPIGLVFENDDLAVVNKPTSIPVHACGGYRLNTLVSILAYERECPEYNPVHRIDRLTSGLVILGKNPTITRTLTELISEGKKESVLKEYLALVRGDLSKNPVVNVEGYIDCIDFRVGKFSFSRNKDSESAKFSRTEFVPISYISGRDETLVKCIPFTGRTHQIRLHLQSIGHPIVNDICYGGTYDKDHPHAIPQIPSLQPDTRGEMFCGGIFLHSFRYRIDDLQFDFQAPLPKWAKDYYIDPSS